MQMEIWFRQPFWRPYGTLKMHEVWIWEEKNTLALLINLFYEFQAKTGDIPTINPLDITMIS